MTETVSALRAAGCVYAEEEAALLIGAADSPSQLSALVARRVSGVPLEVVVGWAEFCGLRILVDEGVFVPRRRTELLAEQALELVGAVVIELCCGVGPVSAFLESRVPDLELYAVDIDPVAVACARRNLRGSVLLGDLYEPLPAGLRVDVLVANAPYVPTDAIPTMPAEARLYEPASSYDGGPDGLDIQRRVAAGSVQWLRPGGSVLIETSERQAAGTRRALREAGLATRVVRDEDRDATVVIGTV